MEGNVVYYTDDLVPMSEDVHTVAVPYDIADEQIVIMSSAPPLQRQLNVPKHGQMMTCSSCGVMIKGRNEFVKHQRAMHPEAKSGTVRCQELGCSFACFRVNKLVQHLQQGHYMEVLVTEHEFECEEDFLEWKESYELNNDCHFRLTSSKVNNSCRYYNCSRTGFYNPKKDVKRRAKHKGTSKMNGHCIAGMVVKLDNETISVVFTETHYGHTVDIGHLRLSASQRSYIEALLNDNYSNEQVVAKINLPNNPISLKTNLTKKDVVNVSYTMMNNRLDTAYSFCSPLSVWDVESDEIGLHDSILFHKATGEDCYEWPLLRKQDFILCVMTVKQMRNVHRYAEGGLCVEVTRGSNNGQLMCLITLIGYDEDAKTDVPLAWCLSNADKMEIKKSFFEVIKGKCGMLMPPFLITNEWDESYLMWTQVFTYSPTKVISSWAIKAAMEAALHKTVVDPANRHTLMVQFELLLGIQDQHSFLTKLQEFIDHTVLSVEFREFSEYFNSNFVTQVDQGWASCYYATHTAKVQKFSKVLTDVVKKMKCYSNKKVGRSVNLLMRYYKTKLVLLDSSFIRRRKRVKMSHIKAEVITDSLAPAAITLAKNIIKMLRQGLEPSDHGDALNKVLSCINICEERRLSQDVLDQRKAVPKKPSPTKEHLPLKKIDIERINHVRTQQIPGFINTSLADRQSTWKSSRSNKLNSQATTLNSISSPSLSKPIITSTIRIPHYLYNTSEQNNPLFILPGIIPPENIGYKNKVEVEDILNDGQYMTIDQMECEFDDAEDVIEKSELIYDVQVDEELHHNVTDYPVYYKVMDDEFSDDDIQSGATSSMQKSVIRTGEDEEMDTGGIHFVEDHGKVEIQYADVDPYILEELAAPLSGSGGSSSSSSSGSSSPVFCQDKPQLQHSEFVELVVEV